MSRCHPTLQRLCPLSPWIGQQRPQIIAPLLPMVPLQAPSAGFAHAMAGSLVWDNFLSHIKKNESGGALALGGRRFINIFINQMEVGVRIRRCIEDDARPGRNVPGGFIFLFGGANWSTKKKRQKYVVALEGRHSKYFHTTINQKHAAAIDKGMKEGYERWGAVRKCVSIILGAIKLGGDKKLNKIGEFTNYFFLCRFT